jgi:hypothetical protein
MKIFIRPVLVLLFTVLVGLTFLFPAAPAAACWCPTPFGMTPTFHGVGATCLDAEDDVFQQGCTDADASCYEGQMGEGSCRTSLEITSPCTWDATAGVYRASGQVRYNCWVC